MKRSIRAIAGVLFASASVVVACSHAKSPDTSPPALPLGQSTAAGPSDPNVPPPDSAGVPDPDQATPPESPPTTMRSAHRIETAEAAPTPGDAGVQRDAPFPSPTSTDSGPTGPLQAPGSNTPYPSPSPNPGPNPSAPGGPTPAPPPPPSTPGIP